MIPFCPGSGDALGTAVLACNSHLGDTGGSRHRLHAGFFRAQPDSTIALLGEIEHAGAVARLAHLQALRHLARLNRRLYELRRASDPTQPTLPLEVFELGTHGISRLVLQAARTRQLAQIRQLRPAILHVYHGLFACGRESLRPPPVEQLLA